MEKLPADRFIGARDFAKALGDSGFRHGDEVTAGVVAGAGLWNPLSIAATAVALLLAVGFGWSLLRPEPPQPVSRLELPLPEGVQLPIGPGPHLSVSPDGSTVVFVGTSGEGVTQLWRRPLAQLSAVPIPGTENANSPRFSPDGQSLAFGVPGTTIIRTVSLSGSPPETPLSGGRGRGPLSWGPDGMIYFTNTDLGLSRVSAAGGEPEVVTTLGEGETGHYDPEVLPNGEAVLFMLETGPSPEVAIAVTSLNTGGDVRVLFRGRTARYSSSGHIVYGTNEGTLYAAPFDSERREVTGTERPILEGVLTNVPGLNHIRSPRPGSWCISWVLGASRVPNWPG